MSPRRSLQAALLLAGFLAGSLASGTAWAGEVPREEATALLELEGDLHERSDLTLQGVHGERGVDFSTPRAWELTADPVLHVEMAHSAALIPHRSHLTVLLNGQAIGTVELGKDNVSQGAFDVTLPRSLLQDFNRLVFSAVQHYTDECEDPFDPALWTRVSRRSTLAVSYLRRRVTDGLEAWPYPLIDTRAIGAFDLTPVLSRPPSPETTRAAGLVALALGRLASYHTVQVAPSVSELSEARTAAFIVGPVGEYPIVETLLGPLSLGEGDGVVAVVPNPADPTLPVLIVSGGGAEGVARAAQALTSQDRQGILSGAWSIVRTVVASDPPPNTQNPRPAPAQDVFPLSALGFKSTTVRGYLPEAVRVPVRLEGNMYIRPGGGTLNLKYGYAAQLDPRLSAMEVRLDGLALRSVPLDRLEGRQDGELSIRLPEELLTPLTRLEVVFHLFPREFDACKQIADPQIWGTVYASSTVAMPRDHMADMPDLSRLRYDGWPLRADVTDGAVTMVLPDAPGPEAWSAGLELTAFIGRLSTTATPRFALELASATSFSANAQSHFVLLADATTHSLYDSLVAAKALAIPQASTERSLIGWSADPLLQGQAGSTVNTIEQILQPSNHTRSALVLHEGGAGGLARLVDTLADPARVSELEGNAVTVAADGSIRVMETAKKERWGQLPMSTEAVLGVRRNWGILGGALVAAALSIVLVVRLWTGARKAP